MIPARPLLFLLGLVLLGAAAHAQPGPPSNLYQINFPHPEKYLFSYRLPASRMRGAGSIFNLENPVLEISGHKFQIHAASWKKVSNQILKNSSQLAVYEGVQSGDTTLHLKLDIQQAPGNAIVRFRIGFWSSRIFPMTKASGGDRLCYTALVFPQAPTLKEIRLSDFNQKYHCSILNEQLLDPADVQEGTQVMGPLLEGSGRDSRFIMAYEHGSQFPDRFLEYRVGHGNIRLSAVRGNYLSGFSPGRLNPFESVWFDFGAVQGSEDELAAQFRKFVLEYITVNSESRKPYIYYNTWGRQERSHWRGKPYLSTMSLDTTLAEIERAHRMGIEVYVIDAGWFLKTGDWEVNTREFPDTLRQVKQLLTRYGMKLGLWFDPETVARSSQIYADNKAYIKRLHGLANPPAPVWETEESVRLSLVSPYWKNYAGKLIRLSRELGVSYFKWDAIGQYGSDAAGHFHGSLTDSEKERSERYAFLLPLYLKKIVDSVCQVVPGAIFDMDITEPGRAVGLSFLSSGKYFIINNGPYFHNFDLGKTFQSPLPNGNSNIFVEPGPARGWFTRPVLAFDKWIPSILFLTHYQTDEPKASQTLNLASLVLGQNGIWGEILKVSDSGVQYVHDVLEEYKKVRDDITLASPIVTGECGSSLEVHEKINPADGRGVVCVFSTTSGRFCYRTQNKASRHTKAFPATSIAYDPSGRAVITLNFHSAGAQMIFFK